MLFLPAGQSFFATSHDLSLAVTLTASPEEDLSLPHAVSASGIASSRPAPTTRAVERRWTAGMDSPGDGTHEDGNERGRQRTMRSNWTKQRYNGQRHKEQR